MGILTNAGKQKILVATPLSPVNIKYMAFGTGQGPILPTQTQLKNEVYRGDASPARKDLDNPNNMIIQGSIPANVGGFTLFEVGLFDVDNVLIAIASLDDGTGTGQYKPVTTGILATRFTFDFIAELVNTTDFELIINDNPDFDHRNISNRGAADSHPISAITGLQTELTGLQTNIDNVQSDLDDKDAQNVKLTGDQTIDGYKVFNGNIGVETINNGNATITLESDGIGISAGSGQNFTAINIDASARSVNVTGDFSATSMPDFTGMVASFAMITAPAGWLKCNGGLVSRTTYAALFAKIGTTFGIGDGSTTFNLPDMRGEFVRGFDDGRGVDSGRAIGSSQTDMFKTHAHTTKVTIQGATTDATVNDVVKSPGTSQSITSEATGGTETRPRNIALLYCIKY